MKHIIFINHKTISVFALGETLTWWRLTKVVCIAVIIRLGRWIIRVKLKCLLYCTKSGIKYRIIVFIYFVTFYSFKAVQDITFNIGQFPNNPRIKCKGKQNGKISVLHLKLLIENPKAYKYSKDKKTCTSC